MRFSRSLQLKISLFLVLCMFLSYSLPVRAAVFPDVNDIIAEWDPNISTAFRDVFNEYKSLAPADRDTADRVIAANAYRYLLSIGSNVLGMTVINEQRFSDFMRAVSPFNMAYNNVVAEYLILAAWSMSGDQYKIFCANVIHNISINSEYYNSHVIKNDPFIDEAAQGSIQFSYNDIDNNQYISVYNNIFLGNILTSTGSSVGVWFNPSPFAYSGIDIDLDKLMSFYSNKPSGSHFVPFVYWNYNNLISSSFSSSVLYIPSSSFTSSYSSYPSGSNYLLLHCSVSSNGLCQLFVDPLISRSSSNSGYYYFSLVSYENPSFQSSYVGSYSQFLSNFPTIQFYFSSSDDLISRASDYFSSYISDYLVYCEGLLLSVEFPNSSTVLTVPFPTGTSFVSPQFQPVNIYDNRVYSSSEDTYWYVDQMIENINNYDYSTNNNGTNNSFYIDNYYIIEAASGGGVQLTTSASITYQYITINNITTGPSIGSGPFDVRIINPEDITSEIITNSNSDILNDYNFNIGDLNLGVSVGSGLSNVASNLDPVVSSGSGIIADFFGGIPPDIATVVFSLLALSIIAGVFYRVTSG